MLKPAGLHRKCHEFFSSGILCILERVHTTFHGIHPANFASGKDFNWKFHPAIHQEFIQQSRIQLVPTGSTSTAALTKGRCHQDPQLDKAAEHWWAPFAQVSQGLRHNGTHGHSGTGNGLHVSIHHICSCGKAIEPSHVYAYMYMFMCMNTYLFLLCISRHTHKNKVNTYTQRI